MGGLARVVLQTIFIVTPYIVELAAAVDWGGATGVYNPRPVYYVEVASSNHDRASSQPPRVTSPSLAIGRKRLIVYHGPAKECDLQGDQMAVQRRLSGVMNSTREAVVYLTPVEMTRLVNHCDGIHARLYQRDPDSYFYVKTSAVSTNRIDRSDVASNEISVDTEGKGKAATASLWSLNMFNRILIFPGTKWCGQGAVAEHYGDIGYHAEADRCCR